MLASFTVYLDYRLRTVVKAFAKSAVKTVVTDCANRASYKVLNELEVDYSSLAKISRNEEGLATTVEIDSSTANKVKSYISNEISNMLASYEDVTFSVPLFAAFGIYYTTLKWPKLDYTVHITTTVVSNFKSNFQSAGINQVLHQILLEVGLESDVAVLGGNTEQFTTTSFIVAETVIVGAVPDAFTSVGHATDEIMEDIFDFGASK
ncbi:MAG: sporulation protein YunB [Clostridia bacterium]|nr:sporulation protein YunB [Clostridia bacterium]